MAKKKHKPDNQLKKLIVTKIIAHPGSMAFVGYTLIALILTFPLILKMNSSVYGFYDHISTDMFATIYYYFWSIQHALLTLKTSPLVTSLFTAPFGARINFVNFTGFVLFPISALFGHLFCGNLVILFNLVVSGLGMFYLVRHITKNPSAGFIAGIIYAFCPNMMVRSYTTFDSTQVQWIPFYTLYILKCIERCTWKHAFLAGIFLTCNILFAMPYYLIYLPVHTMCILLVYACWHMWGKKRGFAELVRDITTREAFLLWMRIAVVLGMVAIVFALYYKVVVGGSEYTSSPDSARTTEQLEELALKPSDYLMPHPRSALLKGTIKESYWNAK
ncbi:MAG TPA: hypothetical protein VMZ04_10800, partial [Anaerolineae bacterium]|nr:hypothetical protein [Anaerolineae bacterium]